MASKNFYEILNSTPSASIDELRSNYKQLILQCHPDKLQQDNRAERTPTTTANATNDGAALHDRASVSCSSGGIAADPNVEVGKSFGEFVAINEAWNTLKDPAKRRQYDAELLLTKFQMHNNVYARLSLAEMTRCCDVAETASQQSDDMADPQENSTTSYYTYNCRCGGQYVVDESALVDNEMLSRMGNNNCGTDDDNDDNHKDDAGDDGEVIVECNECSLVIILNG